MTQIKIIMIGRMAHDSLYDEVNYKKNYRPLTHPQLHNGFSAKEVLPIITAAQFFPHDLKINLPN